MENQWISPYFLNTLFTFLSLSVGVGIEMVGLRCRGCSHILLERFWDKLVSLQFCGAFGLRGIIDSLERWREQVRKFGRQLD